MLKNYIKIAWRTLMHDKGFTALNILSLTIGLTFSLLLFYYIQDELSYDDYHVNGEQVYRVNSTLVEPDKTDLTAISSMVMGPQLKKDYSEVEASTRLLSGDAQTSLKYGENENFIEQVYYADSTIFQVLTHPLIAGDEKTALDKPNAIVLSRTTALLYFKSIEDAIGKSLEGEGDDIYEVTGVMEDVPLKSHIFYNGLISMETIADQISGPGAWGNFGAYTYVRLFPNTNPEAFEEKLAEIYPKFQKSIFEQFNVRMEYSIINIEDIHLKSEAIYEPQALGDLDYIYTFGAVAILLLVIACINYMNLTTARSARRAREIGIRKVSGSLQPQLVAQFITESVMLALISFVISLILIGVLLPTFNDLSGKEFTIASLLQTKTMLYTLLIVLGVGFIGGSYPAFFLAKFDPLVVLKGKLSKASSNAGLRQGLVVVQFTISIVMLIATWVIFNQLSFLQSKELGYDKENVLIVSLPFLDSRTSSTVDLFKKRALALPNVSKASTSYYTPSGNGRNYNLFEVETAEGFTSMGLDNFGVDENFLETFNIELAEGRNFRMTDQPDSSISIIVNETMVKSMGWGEEAIGKKVKNSFTPNRPFLYVIGVMKDFHMRSLYDPIAPLMLTFTHDNGSLQLKVSNEHLTETIASVETLFNESFPGEAMDYSFADENFRAQFEQDETRGTLFSTFSGLTIILAFLGLLGLIAYTTQQRKKEIAVRKIMGADSSQIVFLMAKSFLILVGVACLFAFPIAYYFLSGWLETFTFHTEMNPVVFILSAALILLLTMLTVSYHSIRAAVGNHVNAMRID